MTVTTDKSGVYTDFQGLARLRNQAASDAPAALKEVGKQFESLFIQMMLKSMREATPKDPIFGSQDENTYRDLFDKQLSQELSARGGLGLAEIIVRQLQSKASDPPAPVSGSPVPMQAVSSRADAAGSSPAAFVHAVWPDAERAAKSIGVAPEVLVAQAALETGWGRDLIRDASGRSSNNLFGIKAGADWQGATVEVPTVEYRDGVAVTEHATFRAYDSPAAGFDDYVNLIRGHPRYREALAQAGDAKAYATALQRAGYSTDPHYADKLQGMLGSQALAQIPTGRRVAGGGSPA